MLSREICWIRKKPGIDRTKRQVRLVLPQQHLTGARAKNAIFWKPSQAK
jgi:hypothetical protein